MLSKIQFLLSTPIFLTGFLLLTQPILGQSNGNQRETIYKLPVSQELLNQPERVYNEEEIIARIKENPQTTYESWQLMFYSNRSDINIKSLAHFALRQKKYLTEDQEGHITYSLGKHHDKSGLSDSAIFYFDKTTNLVHKDSLLYFEAVRQLAKIKQSNGDIDAAINLLNPLLERAQNLEKPEIVVNVCYSLSTAEFEAGNFPRSISLLMDGIKQLKAQPLSPPEIHFTNLGRYYNLLVIVYLRTRDYKSALRVGEMGRNSLIGSKNVSQINNLNYNISSAYEGLNQLDSAIYYKQLSLARSRQSPIIRIGLAKLYMKMGDLDLAKIEIERALAERPKTATGLATQFNLVLGEYYLLKGDFQRSLDSLRVLKPMAKGFPPESTLDFYKLLYKVYYSLNQKDSAIHYLKVINEQQERIFDLDKLSNIEAVKRVYETMESERTIELLEVKNKRNTAVFILILSIAFMGVSILVMVVRNSQKKRQLALKDAELFEQKALNLLQESEILAAESILQGREEERKQLSQELHDDVGSRLATLKLHLDAMRSDENLPQDSLNRTTKIIELLDETYDRVRNMSHLNSLEMVVRRGLQISLEKMAKSINDTGKINFRIDLEEFEGLDDKKLIVLVYTTIQELLSNIIKHADAKNVNIQLTQFEDELNVLVEDDGKGFRQSSAQSEGLGLQHLKTRIEKRDGTLIIDSAPKKGTTININIPL